MSEANKQEETASVTSVRVQGVVMRIKAWLNCGPGENDRTYLERGEAEALLSLQDRLDKLEPLLYEVARRADKEWADDGNDFTVAVDTDMWRTIKDSV